MHCKPLASSFSTAACALVLGAWSLAATAAEGDAKPAASADAISYSAGVTIGEGLHRAGVTTEINVDAFERGFKDALGGKATTAEDRERLNQFMTDLRGAIGTRNHTAATAFLAKNGKEKGVVTTASGLQYRIVTAGDAKAASPQPTDQVLVQYRGKLLDGTEFDSSYSRGQPATFPVNGVIKGWQEALVLMKPGSKWEVFVPPELAYDMNSRPPIPPGSALVFDVELISIKAPAPADAGAEKP